MKRNPDNYKGILTGLGFIDNRTSGVRPQQLSLVVAEPGCGKSTFLVQVAHEAWLQGFNVLFVTIEMPIEEIEFKIDSRQVDINNDWLRRAFVKDRLPDEDEEHWRMEIDRCEGAENTLQVIDMPESISMLDIEVHMHDLENRLGIKFDMVCTDHINLMVPTEKTRGGRLDYDSLGVVAQDHKLFARRNKVAVWSAAQAKVTATDAVKKRGGMDNIGMSYLISQPPSLIVHLRKADPDDPESEDVLAARISKYRYGATGVTYLQLDGARCIFNEINDWQDA